MDSRRWLCSRLVAGALVGLAACSTGSGGYVRTHDAPEAEYVDRGIHAETHTAWDRVSTFAVDVDDASYSLARAALDRAELPDPDGVRIEEFVNHFDYGYPEPMGSEGFSVVADGMAASWAGQRVLVRFGLQAVSEPEWARPPMSLACVVDTSGSMDANGHLALVRSALQRLHARLRPGIDEMALITVDDRARVVVPLSNPLDWSSYERRIRRAERRAGGSSRLSAGLQRASKLLVERLDQQKEPRILLFSDGGANRGLTDPESLARLRRRQGLPLLVLGLGEARDEVRFLETLANQADGQYAHLASERDVIELFGSGLPPMLTTVARDVKVQVEFRPDLVASWRQLGYENRGLHDGAIHDDAVDGGEVAAGHSVTALYELTLHPRHRWQVGNSGGELASMTVRYEDVRTGQRVVRMVALSRDTIAAHPGAADPGLRLASAVARFGMVLRGDASRGELQRVAQDLDAIWPTFAGHPDVEDLRAQVLRTQQLTPYGPPARVYRSAHLSRGGHRWNRRR